MPESLESNVWVWKEPDERWKKNVIAHIKKCEPINKELVILHCANVEGFSESIPLANYVLNLCQIFNVFDNERLMFMSPKDLFLAIELCLGRQAKKGDDSDIEISDEDIIQCHKAYVEQFQSKEDNTSDKAVLQLKKFIDENNSADLWLVNDKLHQYKINNNNITEHLSNSKLLILGSLPADVLKCVIGIMMSNDTVLNVTVETPLDISLRGSPSCHSPTCSPQGIEVTSEPLPMQDIILDSSNETRLRSATEEYVEDVIVAFMSLLVNSRNELALSKTMISPIINLSHEAFTELKHLAEEKEMPMCQTAVSYVTQVKLGGKGYAPPADCPMLPHLKSLELFVDTLNQMQTLIEEDLKPISAIKRLVNILKKKLIKCGSEKLKPTAIETASENLKVIADKVINMMKSKKCSNATPQVCQKTLDILHCFVNYVNCSCSTFDPQTVLREKHIKRTPINLPPLLGYFRSPEDETSCEPSEVNEDSVVSNDTSIYLPPVSYFHHSDNSSVSTMNCVDSHTPSKTSFKDCLDERNEDVKETFTKPTKKVNLKKGRKRSILGELTNEISSKIETEVVEKKPKKQLDKKKDTKFKDVTNNKTNKKEAKGKQKGGKKFKLIEGQGRITSFFTMK